LVARKNDQLLAMEIKSNQSMSWSGLNAFKKKFPSAKIAAIDQNLGESFLSTENPEEFLIQLFG
jgi:hypothetical protein